MRLAVERAVQNDVAATWGIPVPMLLGQRWALTWIKDVRGVLPALTGCRHGTQVRSGRA